MCLPISDLAKKTLANGEHLGFEWEVIVNHYGYRCGYIRVLPGHPWFGKYSEIEADCHGGLTFADHGKACASHGPEAEWWIGFDCAHGGDAPDPALKAMVEKIPHGHFMASHDFEVVRTQEYVEAECRSLCEQARVAEGRQ